jgi:hypothetical protein
MKSLPNDPLRRTPRLQGNGEANTAGDAIIPEGSKATAILTD